MPNKINNTPIIVRANGKNTEPLKNFHDNLLKNSVNPTVPKTRNTFLLTNKENKIKSIFAVPSKTKLNILLLLNTDKPDESVTRPKRYIQKE